MFKGSTWHFPFQVLLNLDEYNLREAFFPPSYASADEPVPPLPEIAQSLLAIRGEAWSVAFVLSLFIYIPIVRLVPALVNFSLLVYLF
jgi:hypothetical protein